MVATSELFEEAAVATTVATRVPLGCRLGCGRSWVVRGMSKDVSDCHCDMYQPLMVR